jgi:hypothetical protein
MIVILLETRLLTQRIMSVKGAIFESPISVANIEFPAFGAAHGDLLGCTNYQHAGSSYNQDEAPCKSETTHVLFQEKLKKEGNKV